MPPPLGPSQPYEVHGSGVIFQTLRRLQRQASAEARGEEFLAAIKQIYQRLRQDPTVFGEPAYRLPALKMQVRSAVIFPVAVHFAISEDQQLVFIKSVKLLAKKGS
jgi:hypothetical protein